MKISRFDSCLKILTVFCLLVSSSNFINSQNKPLSKLILSHPVNYYPQKINNYKNPLFTAAVPDTLNVYAIMVQFQQGNNPNVTGNGRFDVSSNYPDTVDAPPHDSAYFANHLEFLKNYYLKASKGKLYINYHILGNVRTMSQTLDNYSPRPGENLSRLGSLFYEAWASADSVIDFSNINPNSAFIIFHAGVGRDVDLISQGIFQGQLDLPSVYMGLSTLKSIYGDTTTGYHTHEGLVISNSGILPEQEFRIINTSFGNQMLELGMNGILVANIGSYLGLPDLFNTQTGVTAIGRFGLMDGQSIFSFLGIFPPEPSAWEKQYLGWVNPVIVNADGNYTSLAASIDFNGNQSVYKVLISGKEYFLLENRNRDANNNGETIRFVRNGIADSIHFTQDVAGFNSDEIWRLSGSITDVEELDWSIPGLKNDTANYQGGIVIWHIDENVIDANIASNSINNDIHHRGVDVEEAKGSQDIGVVISTPLGDFISDGFFNDMWYNGNHYVPSQIYQNAFGPTTIPNSKSYSNFNSRVCLNNFSAIGSSMTFNYQQCGSIVNINNYPHYVGKDTSANAAPIGIDYNGNGQDEVFINVKDSLYGFRDNGSPIRTDKPNGFLKDSVTKFIAGYLPNTINGQTKFITGDYNNKLSLLYFNIDSFTTAPGVIQFNASNILTSPSLVLSSPNIISCGSADGKIFKLDLGSQNITYDSVSSHKIIVLANESSGGNSLIRYIDDSKKYLTEGLIKQASSQQTSAVTVSNDNKLLVSDTVISTNLGLITIRSSPVCCDINKDGRQEIIFTADDKVYAVNQNGVVIDNFPFSVPNASRISSGCSVADIDGDGIYDIIFGTSDGRVYAYNAHGRILDGFPLLTGSEIKSTPAIINTGGNFGIIAYSQDGYLYGWKTQWTYNSSNILWRNYLADANHSNTNTSVNGNIVSGPCLPSDKVYNWPNPAYGTSTNIRYYLGGDATSINIKIMDLSGELVTTLKGTTYKGFDNEVPWDISKVQSGIYIAVVQLTGGCSETASIKIAVVK